MVEPQETSSTQAHTAYFESAVQRLEQLVESVMTANASDEKKLLAAVDLLLKLTGNIVKSPTESKFRTIRSTIPKIQSTLFAMKGGVPELVEALGFSRVD